MYKCNVCKNFYLPLQIPHPNKGKKGKGNVPSNVLCNGTQHVIDRAELGLGPSQSALSSALKDPPDNCCSYIHMPWEKTLLNLQ